MPKSLKVIIDYIAIILAITTFVLSFVAPEWEYLNILTKATAIGCVCYVIYAVYLFCQKPLFDWHLINGNFLLKVLYLAIAMPFTLTMVIGWGAFDSKELVYSSNLYTPQSKQEIKNHVIEGNICINDSTHTAKFEYSSIETTDATLPDSIKQKQSNPSLFWSVYTQFIDPGNQHMSTTTAGRNWAALVAIFGVFLLNGLLVSSIIGSIDTRKGKWFKGEIKYPGFLRRKKHYIIIGGNDMSIGIVKQLLAKIYSKCTLEKPYILIQTSRDVEAFRRELFSALTKREQQRVIIYYGNRNSDEDIKALCLSQAQEVYILGEEARTDDNESYHDTMNMNCLKLISNNLKGTNNFNESNKLTCRVMFEYQTSFNIIQVTDIDAAKIKFIPFNYYEMWAQNVLICQELKNWENCKYLPLEGFEGIKPTDSNYAHLVIVGMSRMGIAMAIEAAHLAHYPNYSEEKKIRTKITFIDKNAAEEKEFFIGRFKEMFNLAHWRYGEVDENNGLVWCKHHIPTGHDYLGGDFLDIEWEFINSSIVESATQQYLASIAANKNAKLTIAICYPENTRAIAAATYMPDEIYKSDSTLQVLVYQRLNDDLLSQINQNNRYCGKLKAFGIVSMCYNSSLVEISEEIASKIGARYNQYTWDTIKQRYAGKGLIEEDYENLSGYLFNDKDYNKEQIIEECNTWMSKHHSTAEYATLKESLKELNNKIKNSYRKNATDDTNLASATKQSGGKSKAAKMWSDQYNIYSMWTKFRCVATNGTTAFDPMHDEFDGQALKALGQAEHNRWVTEQLLLRYRPLNKEEQEKAKVPSLYSSTKQKAIYKKAFAHLDICSNEILDSIDYNMSNLDQELIGILPKAYRAYLAKKQ